MSDLGTCPVCHHLIRLTPAGRLATHLVTGVVLVRERHRRWRCTGSGRFPQPPENGGQAA